MVAAVADGGSGPSLLLQLFVSGIVLGSVNALLGTSVSTIYSTTKVFHFAHAVTYTASAYVAIEMVTALDLPVVLAVVVGPLVALALGVLIEVVVYRPMRERGATSLGIFLASLGLSIAGPNLIQILFGPDALTLPVADPHLFRISGATYTSWDVVTVIVAWVLIGVVLRLRTTRYGLASTAVAANPDLSAAVGISAKRVYVYAFAIGSLLVGAAAVLFLLNQPASPNMGLQPVLIGFIATFLGGIGSTRGAPAAGFALGMLVSLSGLWFSQTFQTAVIFGLLFVFLIARPQGVFGKVLA